MIQLSSIPVENIELEDGWKQQLKQSRLSTTQLLQKLGHEDHPLANEGAESLFELMVPPVFLNKIEYGNPEDPLLLQVLPQNNEFAQIAGYIEDPLLEKSYSPAKGLIHKYKNRVLLITNSTCAINCRYCFRRNFPYEQHRQSRSDWKEALAYIEQNDQLDEVILSGGEPLLLSNTPLFELINKIDKITHVKRIRIHTRLLTTIPSRIDTVFLKEIKKLNKNLIIVLHTNHANELGLEHKSVFKQLRQCNITLLNQAVLLKNVNDDSDTLKNLSLKLFEYDVIPYYLFLLDKVTGTAHFDLPLPRAKTIYKELQGKLPGYLVPRLSVEEPGNESKSLVS